MRQCEGLGPRHTFTVPSVIGYDPDLGFVNCRTTIYNSFNHKVFCISITVIQHYVEYVVQQCTKARHSGPLVRGVFSTWGSTLKGATRVFRL